MPTVMLQPPFLIEIRKVLTLRGTLIFKTQGVCRAGTSSEGGLISRLVCDP
jgi:hypothetical protein